MKTYVVERAALLENIRLVREQAGKAEVWAVLKGDGYGLGLLPLARLLRQQGIDRFAVTEVSEARRLREGGFEQELILMLRATADPQELEQLIDLNVIATLGSSDDAVALNGIAGRLGTVAEAHIAFDTGMGRYGFLAEELPKVTAIFEYMENIAITGVYTHFSCAFCSRKKTQEQFAAFTGIIDRLTGAGYAVGERHCANSSALFLHPETRLDAVRVGSAFLGRLSFRGKTGLRRVGYCEATVEELRQLPVGATVGYGAGYTTKKITSIAVLSVGWYNGFGIEKGRDLYRFSDTLRGCLSLIKAWLTRRRLYVILQGRKCPVLGHVGMLHTVVDVTGMEVHIGDQARLEINPLDQKGLKVEYR